MIGVGSAGGVAIVKLFLILLDKFKVLSSPEEPIGNACNELDVGSGLNSRKHNSIDGNKRISKGDIEVFTDNSSHIVDKADDEGNQALGDSHGKARKD